jgi:hypothetical protein
MKNPYFIGEKNKRIKQGSNKKPKTKKRMTMLYSRYDDSKWAIPRLKGVLLAYIQEILLPFPQSIHFKQDAELLIYAERMQPIVHNLSFFTQTDFYNMLADVSTQLAFYVARGHAHVGFGPEDIVEICISSENNKELKKRYVIVSDEYVCSLNPHNKKEAQIVFLSGAGPPFCSPEIRCKVANQLFPIKVHVNAGYFGFGKYMEHLLTNMGKNQEKNQEKNQKKTKKQKRSIKLNGFLQRCFDSDESARKLLYL